MRTEFSLEKFLPYKSKFLLIDGSKLHYLDEGTGPVVILLHGNPTWCFYYRNLITALKDKFRVIAPDYIGCGLSDHPPDSHYTAIDRINHLQELVNSLGLTRYSLVMHDWGGAIGTGLAVRNIGAIEKLVYLNTTLTETESLPGIIKTAATPVIGKLLTKKTKFFLKLMTGYGVSKKLPQEIKDGYYYPYKTSERRTAIWDFVADIPFDNTHPSYSEMLEMASKIPELENVPVKIIWGLKDLCFHREMLSKVARHFPQAEIHEIPEASHLVLEDAPVLANSLIKEFLESDPKVEKSTIPVEGGLYAGFKKIAGKYPRQDAAISPTFFWDNVSYFHTNYENLDSLVNKYERGLTELGLKVGHKVLMLVTPGIEFLALSYAVMGRGGIPVFIDPGIGRENLFKCIESINPDVFLGSPLAQLLRLKKKKLFPNIKFHLTASEWIYTGGPNLSYLKSVEVAHHFSLE